MSKKYLTDLAARDYVSLFLSFVLGVGIALAPALGAVGVPGLRVLYFLLPVDIQDVALPVSSLLSGLAALYATIVWRQAPLLELKRWFKRWFWIALSAVIIFSLALMKMAVAIPVEGGDYTMRFSIGPFERPHKPPCLASVSDVRCISLVTTNPARIREMWGADNVEFGQISIFLGYLGVIGSIGAAIGTAWGVRVNSTDLDKPSKASRVPATQDAGGE